MPYWVDEPSILFDKKYVLEIFPTESMNYEQKINAITRLVILIALLGYIFTASLRILITGGVVVAGIYILFKSQKIKLTKDLLNEGFKDRPEVQINNSYMNPVTLDSVLKTEYKKGTVKNPFSNVLLTEINDEPERKAAPPAFNVNVEEDITKNIKKTVQKINPNIKNTNRQLFDSLWDNFELDQSNRRFYSTANTQVQPGDQSSFAQYLYGYMPSAKEDTPEGNMQRYKDSYRYTLY